MGETECIKKPKKKTLKTVRNLNRLHNDD